MTFNFQRKTTVYRKDFVQFRNFSTEKVLKPEDSLMVYDKHYEDPFKNDTFRHELVLIEHQLDGCTSDLWNLIRQKVLTRRAFIRRMKEKYAHTPEFQ